VKYYKFLTADGSATYGTGKWNLPHDGQPGEWMPDIVGDIVPCENGYHACRPQDVALWCNATMYELEYQGDIIEADDKVVGRRARLLRKIEAWDERTVRLFAADCAERVLPFFEKERPNDDRPRKAIQASRDYANGVIDAAAWDAARAAAWDAARAAAWAAAWDAAMAAAWAAARAAAMAAAWAAARAAAWAAAWDAAMAAARDAAWDAERAWQSSRLLEMVGEMEDR
jgi:hypothetical protein